MNRNDFLQQTSLIYLKYKNKRANFVDELFDFLNWDNASERLEVALILVKRVIYSSITIFKFTNLP